MKDNQNLQIEMFENQIELAKAFKKPMVLHIVQAHSKAIQILNIWSAPPEKGLVHGFTGSFDTAKSYIDKGFFISIGGAITYEKNHKVQDCVKKMPLEHLLLETDAPDQPLFNQGAKHNSLSLFKVAEKVGQIRQMDTLEVLEINTANFKRLFRL
jgi:TatD DNase family protein